MSDTSKQHDQLPYKPLGIQLKHLREGSKESMAEVSGAVEIEETALSSIESGKIRPSEDILLLLISHFGIQDDKAAELWELAGYDKPADDHDHEEREHSGKSHTSAMMVMIDPRVMYSDSVEISANKQGVVLGFSQNGGQGDQPLTVARIGMSKTQAKLVMGILHQALYEMEQSDNRRQLGDGGNDSSSGKKSKN